MPLYGEQPGQVVALVGSLPELGAWNASNAVKLRKGVDGMWRADLRLPVGVKFEAKVGACSPMGDSAGRHTQRCYWCNVGCAGAPLLRKQFVRKGMHRCSACGAICVLHTLSCFLLGGMR